MDYQIREIDYKGVIRRYNPATPPCHGYVINFADGISVKILNNEDTTWESLLSQQDREDWTNRCGIPPGETETKYISYKNVPNSHKKIAWQFIKKIHPKRAKSMLFHRVLN